MYYNSLLSGLHHHQGSFVVVYRMSSDSTTSLPQANSLFKVKRTFPSAPPLWQLRPRWDLTLRSAPDTRPYFARDDVSYSVLWREYRGVLKWVVWC